MGRFRLVETLWVVLSFSVNTSEAFRARSRAMSLLGGSQGGIKLVERHMMGAQVAEKTNSKLSVKSLSDNDLRGKTVLVRCDLNVPLDGSRITDDTRIRESIPTIDLLRSKGAKVVLASHLGRPKGKPDPAFSLLPVAGRLSELIGQKVDLAPDCVGPSVKASMKSMKDGDVLLLENVRFHSGETDNSPEFSKSLSEGVDIFVNDAFGTAHRAHSSTAGICSYVERSAAGLLLQKELEYLQGAVETPKRPFMAIVGGSKVSTKMGVLKALVNKVDKLVLGGAMVFTFFKAEGVSVGSSLVEDDKMELAMEIKKMASDRGVELILPVDVVVGDSISKDAKSKIVNINGIEDGWLGLDNGPKTNAMIEKAMTGCSTILWNGPMGVSEFQQFAAGTESVAKTLAALTKTGTTSIVGGGDSVAAVQRMGLGSSMSHVSTGGGASLELLEGKELPGVAALSEA